MLVEIPIYVGKKSTQRCIIHNFCRFSSCRRTSVAGFCKKGKHVGHATFHSLQLVQVRPLTKHLLREEGNCNPIGTLTRYEVVVFGTKGDSVPFLSVPHLYSFFRWSLFFVFPRPGVDLDVLILFLPKNFSWKRRATDTPTGTTIENLFQCAHFYEPCVCWCATSLKVEKLFHLIGSLLGHLNNNRYSWHPERNDSDPLSKHIPNI